MTRSDPYGYPVHGGERAYPYSQPLDHDEPGADEKAPTAEQHLWQMGYFRTDTNFCSLNLTTEQLDVFFKAQLKSQKQLEVLLTEALTLWMEQHA